MRSLLLLACDESRGMLEKESCRDRRGEAVGASPRLVSARATLLTLQYLRVTWVAIAFTSATSNYSVLGHARVGLFIAYELNG